MKASKGRKAPNQLMKEMNLDRIFKLIVLNHPVSRAQLSVLARLNKTTVSGFVDYLIQQGVIEEIGSLKPRGGRPPILLDLKKDFGVFVGVEYNTIASVFLITDIEGKVLKRSKLAGRLLGPDEFIRETTSLIKSCNEEYGYTKRGVLGVGIATPNNYNRLTGKVEYLAGHEEWKGYPVRDRLRESLGGIPTYIMQAVTAATLGEVSFGSYDPEQHLACLFGAWGLNLAMYAGGYIYDGYEGFSGRFGHTVIEVGGRQCTCGNRGCLEAYASVHALIERLYPSEMKRAISDQTYRHELVERSLRRLEEGDKAASEACLELCEYLAIAIVNIVNTYNPAAVCIGGYLSLVVSEPMLERLRGIVRKMLPSHLVRSLNISRSLLGEYASAFGCISNVRNHLIDILLQ